MSAREVIAQTLFEFSGNGQGVDDMLAEIANAQTETIIDALTAAGYRILAPGELDDETLERALQVAEAFDGKPCGPAQLWNEEQRQFFDAGQLDASSSIAAGIRALKADRRALEGDGRG